jgi:hypothetical protein
LGASAVGRLFEGAGRRGPVRWGAGVALCVFGLWTISGVAWMSHAHGHGHVHDATCGGLEADAPLVPPASAHREHRAE